jgi:hypothetical protein
VAAAQTTIQYKGKDLLLAGKSAGAVKGKNDNPTSYECFVDINTETKMLTCATVQTFSKYDEPPNDKDIEVRQVAINELNLELLSDNAELSNDYAEPCYVVNVYTIESKDLVTVKYCWRMNEETDLIAGDPVWGIMLVFKEKTAAAEFIKTIKTVK